MFSEDTLRALARDAMDVSRTTAAKEGGWSMGLIILKVCDNNRLLANAVAVHMNKQSQQTKKIIKAIKKVRRERNNGQLTLF